MEDTLVQEFRRMRRQRKLYEKQLRELEYWNKCHKKGKDIPLLSEENIRLLDTQSEKGMEKGKKRSRKACHKAWKEEKKNPSGISKEYFELTWTMKDREEQKAIRIQCEEINHYFTNKPTTDVLRTRIQKWEDMIEKLEEEYEEIVGGEKKHMDKHIGSASKKEGGCMCV